jgi:predicted phage tail component-like protein
MRSRNRQLLPEPNDKYMQVPGRQGSILFPGGLADRRIEIDCAFRGNKLPDLRIRAREIAAWLYTENREILSFDDEPEKYYRGKLAQAIDFEHLAVMGQFSLIFECEPLAYGAEVLASFINDTATVDNQGTFESQPVFTAAFTGAASEWKVTGPGDNYIRVVHAFQAGDALEVNAATGAILINGTRAMDKLDWQNSRFFCLRVGESVLNVTPAGVCSTRVSWVPRYL